MICRFARVNWLRHDFSLRFHELNCFSHARQRNSCGAAAIHDACINSCAAGRNSCQKDVSKPYRRFRKEPISRLRFSAFLFDSRADGALVNKPADLHDLRKTQIGSLAVPRIPPHQRL